MPPLHPDTKRIAIVLAAALAVCAWMAGISFRVGALYAYFSGLLKVDSAASWIVGILFIDELIIAAIIVAAVAVAAFDGRKIRTIHRTKR